MNRIEYIKAIEDVSNRIEKYFNVSIVAKKLMLKCKAHNVHGCTPCSDIVIPPKLFAEMEACERVMNRKNFN